MNDLDILIANINALYKQEIDPSTKRFLGKKGNIVDLFASFKNLTDAQKKKNNGNRTNSHCYIKYSKKVESIKKEIAFISKNYRTEFR